MRLHVEHDAAAAQRFKIAPAVRHEYAKIDHFLSHFVGGQDRFRFGCACIVRVRTRPYVRLEKTLRRLCARMAVDLSRLVSIQKSRHKKPGRPYPDIRRKGKGRIGPVSIGGCVRTTPE